MIKCPMCGKNDFVKKKGIALSGHCVYVCTSKAKHEFKKNVHFYENNTIIEGLESLRYLKCEKCGESELISIHDEKNECKKYVCENRRGHENKKDFLFPHRTLEKKTFAELFMELEYERDLLKAYKKIYEKRISNPTSPKVVDLIYIEILVKFRVSRELISHIFRTTEKTLRKWIDKIEKNGGCYKNSKLYKSVKVAVCNTKIDYSDIFQSELTLLQAKYDDIYFDMFYDNEQKNYIHVEKRNRKKRINSFDSKNLGK